MASNLLAMAFNLAMASNLIAMASNLIAMASNLIAKFLCIEKKNNRQLVAMRSAARWSSLVHSGAEAMTTMGINGFGRIGRLVFRAAVENQSVPWR